MSLSSFFKDLIDQIVHWLSPQPPPPPPLPAGETVRPRVLLIIYNPTIPAEGGRKLTEVLDWNDPDALARGYISDLRESSGGFVDYDIVQRIEVDAWPVKIDGFRYDATSYLRCHRTGTGWHEPDRLEYEAILDEFDLLARVNARQIDEVWIFGFPFAGFYESRMVGPGAFWCNAPPMKRHDVDRRFIIMGFNYERGVGEMLESYGHRTESHMERVWRHAGDGPDRNLWHRFILYDKKAPGESHCGNVHYAPNSQTDYDWGNPTPVDSYCDDWFNYPDFQGVKHRVDSRAWGNGDIRAHHVWWLSHLPRAAGETQGISNNWWWYVVEPDAVR
jgi:hypothetical protein